MQFISDILGKKIYTSLSLHKEVFIAVALIFLPILYPKTAHADLFSFFSNMVSDEASAKTIDTPSVVNSQTMAVLQAPVNINPNPNTSATDAPVISGNALVAEIGPSGTLSDVEDEISTEISLYTVRDGDSLAKIAKMFGVSVNTIIWANDLSKNPQLKNGQTLIILPISGIRYTIKKGDTIKGIVAKYKADLNEVLEYNDLVLSSMLSVGDTIVIPDAEPTAPIVPKIGIFKKSSTNPVHDANGPYYPGYYVRPIDEGHKSQGLHGYNAVDLAAPLGTPIHAAAEGVVIASVTNNGYNGGYGNYVIISHPNGTQTLYAHTQKNFVKPGDRVEQGELIARIGMTGKSTGPHVHFEIRGARNPF